ncbi:MAG: glycosyltransferase [Cyanophyceae cyanobacterium]
MVRVAFIAGTYRPQRCGVADYTAHLRAELSAQGVESCVLTTDVAAVAVDEAAVRGVVPNWRLADMIPLVCAVKSTAADILHIQHAAGTYGFQRPVFLLPLLLRLVGDRKPIVTTVHEYGWWEWEPPGIPPQWLEGVKQWGQQRGWWEREDGFLLTGSQAIITTNADAQRVILERLPHKSEHVYRIPIAASVGTAANPTVEYREQYGWQAATVIAFFGFLHPVKGIENLLSALQPIARQHPQVRLLLVGGVESLALPAQAAQEYWEKLHALIDTLHLKDVVEMTGYVEAEVASHYLARADIGVLPFNHGVTLKSSSLLTLMAHGLPIVATRHEPPDLDLDHQVCLVPPRNVAALREALLKLISDREQRDRLAQQGREFVRRFTWSDIAHKHLRIYKQLMMKEDSLQKT